jgi:hypothetical protein
MAYERPDLEAARRQKLTVIAWLWARTVKSPNPAFSHVDVPLTPLSVLQQGGKEAYVQPVVMETDRFAVKFRSAPPPGRERHKATGRGPTSRCIVSGTASNPATLQLRQAKPAWELMSRRLSKSARWPGLSVYDARMELSPRHNPTGSLTWLPTSLVFAG